MARASRSRTSPTGSGRASHPGAGQAYELETQLRERPRLGGRRPVPLRAERRRGRPVPVGPGPSRAALARARRARDDRTRTSKAPASRSGRRTPARLGSSATSTRGTASGTRCARSAAGRLGAVRPGARRGQHLQVRAAHGIRRLGQARRPDGALHRGAAGHGIRRRAVVVRVGGRRLDARASRARPAQLAAERVRAAPRLLAAGARRIATRPTS